MGRLCCTSGSRHTSCQKPKRVNPRDEADAYPRNGASTRSVTNVETRRSGSRSLILLRYGDSKTSVVSGSATRRAFHGKTHSLTWLELERLPLLLRRHALQPLMPIITRMRAQIAYWKINITRLYEISHAEWRNTMAVSKRRLHLFLLPTNPSSQAFSMADIHVHRSFKHELVRTCTPAASTC